MFEVNHVKTLLKKLFLSILILSLILIANKSGIFAAPVSNGTTGMWSDTFSDNTGLGSKTFIDVSGGSLQLTNAGGGFVAPFQTEGSATSTDINPILPETDYINPNSIAKYNNLNINATVPANTTATVQLNAFNFYAQTNYIVADSIIPGNSAGFNLTTGTTTINISSLLKWYLTSKYYRLYLKTNLATTDINVTPTINRAEVAWTPQQGNLSATTLARSGWPINAHDLQGTFRSQYSGPGYPTFKYFKPLSALGPLTRHKSIVDASGHYILSTENVNMQALNKSDGANLWTSPFMYNSNPFLGYDGMTAATNGTIYGVDIGNDFLYALDDSDGIFKAIKRTMTGGLNSTPALSDNGKLFWIEFHGYNPTTTVATLVSANSDLSKNWGNSLFLDSADIAGGYVYNFSNLAFSPDQSKMYFDYSRITSVGNANKYNEGRLYAFNSSTGSLAWSYNMGPGDAGAHRIFVGSDGTIYAGSSYYSSDSRMPPPANPSVYAINPNGTLKWSYTFSGTDYFMTLQSLGSDRVFGLVTDKTSYTKYFALSLTDGSVLWKNSINFRSMQDIYSYGIADNSNNIFSIPNNNTSTSTTVQKLDSSGNIKWGINYPAIGAINLSGQALIDEAGNLFVASGSANSAYAGLSVFTNWTLSSTDISAN
ncbi:MAG: PQQ-binding-like beta-propeller repeat protein, partial [Patescibacteria group bacterium]